MSELLLSYILITLAICFTLIPYIVYFNKKRKDIFEPIYWATAYFSVLYIVRPLYDLTIGSVFLGSPPFDNDTMTAFNLSLIYIIISFICVLLGYYSIFGKLFVASFRPLPIEWDQLKVYYCAPLFLVVGFISYYALINSFGGITYYLFNKADTLTATGLDYIYNGINCISLVFVMGLTRFYAQGKGRIITFAFLFPIVLLVGILSGGKAGFLIPFLYILLAYHYLKKRVKISWIFTFVVVTILAIPFFNAYRYADNLAQIISALDKMLTEDNDFLIKQVMGRFYGIDSLTIIIRDTPNVMDYQLGATILPLLYAWIPRALWPDKPIISFSKIFGETYLGQFFSGTGTAASVTMLGEVYLNFHIAGMIVGSFLIGLILRAIYEYLIVKNLGAPAVFIYASLFLYLFVFWEFDIAGFLAGRFIYIAMLAIFVATMGKSAKILKEQKKY